jgi:3-dehydroquinate synthase
MREVEVALGERSYRVTIGAGLLDRARDWLGPFESRGKIMIVTDVRVFAAQGERLRQAGFTASNWVALPPGEDTKSWRFLESLVDSLIAAGLERGDHVVAFGGGMIGDLAGFAAAIYKRGCHYIQVPTTLLAQVDSSVGGKTAINSSAGKNLIGAFHQPAAVFIDPTTLDTLDGRQLRAGYAEVVKYGLIGDPGFFDWCEANGAALLAGDGEARLHAIESCVRAKAAIVAEDEKETSGRRALLNFGHTFGHALEAETGFALLHGEAVALGMALAFRFSAERGLCGRDEAERVAAHLGSAGLSTRLEGVSAGRLVRHMAGDKKASGGRVAFVLTRGIGKAFVDRSVEPSEVEAFLEQELRR